MMTHLTSKISATLFTLLLGVVASSSAYGAANIVIQNGDPAGVGFNDPTPAAPVGGNSGTTLGKQRLNAFQHAANIWGATLNSGPTITVRATWEELTCDASSGVLGSAGSFGIWRNFPGAPVANTWYSSALANALSGSDLDPANAEIRARFNVRIGTAGCLESRQWYLGLDTNHGSNINLVTVLLHEFSHGLGFQTFTDKSTGAMIQGYASVYDRFLHDNTSGKTWAQMNDSERVASGINTGNLVWTGPRVVADATLLTAGKDSTGRPLLYTPNPLASGSSISHWDRSHAPNQLMEPSISTSLTHNVVAPYDLTTALFADIGWSTNAAPPPPPTPTPTPTPTTASATVQFSATNYSSVEGNGTTIVTVTRGGSTQSAASVEYFTSDSAGQTNCASDGPTSIASERCDYQTAVGVVRFEAGQTTATVAIPIINDTHVEGSEFFNISLRNPIGINLDNSATATISIVDDDLVPTSTNPIDSFEAFVRQQYLDFLSREPDSGGFSYWLGRLQACAAQTGCDIVKERKTVSAGFFYSNEFLLRKGYFVYRFYRSSLGRQPGYGEFIPDLASMGQSDGEEEAKRVEFTNHWVNRPEFKAVYDGLSNADFVNRLVDTAGVSIDRTALINSLNAGESRATIVRQVAESQPVFDKFFKEAFISMQYFGYLRRDPDSGGFSYWMGRLPASRQEIEANPEQYIYDMVGGFVYSTEYQLRFGPRNY